MFDFQVKHNDLHITYNENKVKMEKLISNLVMYSEKFVWDLQHIK